MDILLHRGKRLVLILLGTAALAGGPAAVATHAETNEAVPASYDCAGGKKWFDQRVADYNTYTKAGNVGAAADALKDAKAEKTRAGNEGCDTSGWTLPFTGSPSGYRAPTGQVLIAGAGGTSPGPVTAGGGSGAVGTP